MKRQWIEKALAGLVAVTVLGILAGCERSPASAETEASQTAGMPWLTNYQAAMKLAAEQNKLVLINFTGSDWCGFCIQLKKQVFNTSEFQRFAQEKLILLEVDFPRAKPQNPDVVRQNEKLRNQFGVEGFPTLVLLNPEGKEVKRSVGLVSGGLKGFLKWVES